MESFFRPAHRGEHFSITTRREFEDSRLSLDQQRSISQKLLEHAHWEQRSNTLVRKNAIQRYSHTIKQQHQFSLNDRREKLKLLLEAEEAQYKAEIAALTETQAQRAERVRTAARALKQNRENRAKQFAEAQYERQWQESCDDLRTIDSHFFSLHCADTIQRQIEEKQENAAVARANEMKSAQEWEAIRLRRVAEEEENLRKRRENTVHNRRALSEQIAERELFTQQVREKEEKEKEIILKLQAIDAENEQRKLAEENERKKSANRENVRENLRLQEERRRTFEREREEQRRELERLMAEYRAETAKQAAQQKKFREDLSEYQFYLQQRKEREARMEAEMDRLIEEDVKREESKRDAKWAKEAQARRHLMTEVQHTRAQQVDERAAARMQQRKEKELDKRAIDEEIVKNQRLEQQEAEREEQLKLIRAAELEAQTKLNYYKERRQELERLREKKEFDEAEAQYQQRLKLFREQKIAESQKHYHVTDTTSGGNGNTTPAPVVYSNRLW